MKKYLIGFLVGAMLFSSIGVFAEGLTVLLNPYPVYVNGTQVPVEGYNIDGFTYLKLADIGKSFDATVLFNETENRIDVKKNPKSTTENKVVPSPTEPPIETINFFVSYINKEVWAEENGITYECVPAKGKAEQFTINTATQGYWDKDGRLFLQNAEGKFIGCHVVNQRMGDD